MKLNVYQEQYKSGQAKHNPEAIGFGYDINSFRNLGNTLVGATYNKLAQDDELNSARIEADTVLAADKMYRDYVASASPDNFEKDIEGQQSNIQNLIANQAKNFKLPKYQTAFKEKMTRGLEEQYMNKALQYSYTLQEERYKELGNSAFDSFKAQLLAGNSFLTVPDVMGKMQEYYTTLAVRYHIPQTLLDSEIKRQNTSIVKSYAYGMIDKDPKTVRDLLVGNSFDKYKAYKESVGEGFTMEEFWQNDTLRKEYAESEFGAKYVDVIQYLDYDTRTDLWKLAETSISNQEKEELKRKLLQNSMSGYDLDKQRDAAILYAKEQGKLPTNLLGVSKVNYLDDPELGDVGNAIAFGEVTKGPVAKGNSITTTGMNFAKGISGAISSKGYKTYITSNLRPGDHNSMHKDGSAVDIQVFTVDKKSGSKVMTDQGIIEAYKGALALYKNNLKKGGTLLEIDPARLDYIKKQLEAEGIDTSYINWSQSKQYGAKALANNSQHIHFGINAKADYTRTNSGKNIEYTFRTQQGKQRYLQQRADGKSPQDAYDKARQDELDILSAVQERALIQNIVGVKNSDGTLLDPAYYGRALEEQRQAILRNKSMSNEDRIIALKAIDNAKSEIPKLQEMFRNDTSTFMQVTNQASTPEEAAVLQLKRYGIAPDDVMMMSNEEAKTKADQLYSKLAPDQAVKYLGSNSVNPAALRQIAKYMPNDSKTNLLMYSAMATGPAKSQIISALQSWPDVQKAMQQRKDIFPTNWKEKTLNQFKNHKAVKSYLEDISKTSPQEANKMLDAMTSLYAYRMYSGATNSKNTIDDIVTNLIGANFNTITVNTNRYGKTPLNVAVTFSGNDLYKITRVCNMVSKIGLDKQAIFIPGGNLPTGKDKVSKEIRTQASIQQANWLKGILNTAKLSGTPDGTEAFYTWENSKGISAGSRILAKGTQQPIKLRYIDMVSIYNEAYKLKESWRYRNTDAYRVPSGKYRSIYGTSEAEAMNAALEHILTNKYKWLNRTDYTQFRK